MKLQILYLLFLFCFGSTFSEVFPMIPDLNNLTYLSKDCLSALGAMYTPNFIISLFETGAYDLKCVNQSFDKTTGSFFGSCYDSPQSYSNNCSVGNGTMCQQYVAVLGNGSYQGIGQNLTYRFSGNLCLPVACTDQLDVKIFLQQLQYQFLPFVCNSLHSWNDCTITTAINCRKLTQGNEITIIAVAIIFCCLLILGYLIYRIIFLKKEPKVIQYEPVNSG